MYNSNSNILFHIKSISMKQSRLSFNSPNFRINTDSSNPQNSSLKMPIKQSIINHCQEISFKKPMKEYLFEMEQSQSDSQIPQVSAKLFKNGTERIENLNKKMTFKNKANIQNCSPQIIQLLSNCKTSIKSLQEDLSEKQIIIRKLEKQKVSLWAKLSQSQKQTQRIQQILNIYIKQSKQNRSKSVSQHQLQTTILSNSRQQKNQELQRTKHFLTQENEYLKNLNASLQTEFDQLKTQNFIMSQKIHKMGKGVGKALSTIKKNHKSTQKISQFVIVSEEKPSSKKREHGKILTLLKKDTPGKSYQVKFFQTPKKSIIQAHSLKNRVQQEISFYEASEQKMIDISRKAKRLDQLQKLQQILSKMQKLAEQEQESSSDPIN